MSPAGPITSQDGDVSETSVDLPGQRPSQPRVRLSLPDGQTLDVTLVSWHQYQDGSWRARVRWPLWGAFHNDAHVETRACQVEAYVPSHSLIPLDGEDYRVVRRRLPRIEAPDVELSITVPRQK
jgi:hypothetical protein